MNPNTTQIDRRYSPPAMQADRMRVSVSIEVEGADGDAALALADELHDAVSETHKTHRNADQTGDPERDDTDPPDAVLAAANAVCEWDDLGRDFVEAAYGDERAAVFCEDGEMVVESDHAHGDDPVFAATITPGHASLVAAARELGREGDG